MIHQNQNLIPTPTIPTPANSLQQPSMFVSYGQRSIGPYPGSSPFQNGPTSYVNPNPMTSFGVQQTFSPQPTPTSPMGIGGMATSMNVPVNMGMGGMGMNGMMSPMGTPPSAPFVGVSGTTPMGYGPNTNMGISYPMQSMGMGRKMNTQTMGMGNGVPQFTPSTNFTGMPQTGYDPNTNMSMNYSTQSMGMGGMGLGQFPNTTNTGNFGFSQILPNPPSYFSNLPRDFRSISLFTSIKNFMSLQEKDFTSSFNLGQTIGNTIIQNPGTSIDKCKTFFDGFTKEHLPSPESMTGFWQGILSTCFEHYDKSHDKNQKEKLADFAFDNILNWSSRKEQISYDNVAKIITSFCVDKISCVDSTKNAAYIDGYKQTESTTPTVLMGYMFKAISKKPDFCNSFFEDYSTTVPDASSESSYKDNSLNIPDADKPLWFKIAMHCLFNPDLKEITKDHFDFAITNLKTISVDAGQGTQETGKCSMLGILHIIVAKSLAPGTEKETIRSILNSKKYKFDGSIFHFHCRWGGSDWNYQADKGVRFYKDIIQDSSKSSSEVSATGTAAPTPPEIQQQQAPANIPAQQSLSAPEQTRTQQDLSVPKKPQAQQSSPSTSSIPTQQQTPANIPAPQDLSVPGQPQAQQSLSALEPPQAQQSSPSTSSISTHQQEPANISAQQDFSAPEQHQAQQVPDAFTEQASEQSFFRRTITKITGFFNKAIDRIRKFFRRS